MEIFPKQDRVQDGPGSPVRLPLGVHRRSVQRYAFDQPAGSPAPTPTEQLRAVAAARPVPTAYVAAVLAEALARARCQVRVALAWPESHKVGLVAHIKREFDIYAVVGQMIDLTPTGHGHCRFHDDAHKSFSVNGKGGHFNCFAGYGGGDGVTF